MNKLIRLELKATLKRYRPDSHDAYSIESGICVKDLVKQLGVPEYEVYIVFIDGVLANLDSSIKDGALVTLFPPLDGG